MPKNQKHPIAVDPSYTTTTSLADQLVHSFILGCLVVELSRSKLRAIDRVID
jgi:hypothetical protein